MNSPLLGVDIGFKRTGLALSESGLLVRPLRVVETDLPHMAKAINGILEALTEHGIRTLVIGLPSLEDGTSTPHTERTRKVIDRIGKETTQRGLDLEIVTVNEFGSTRQSADLYPGAEPDAAAAAFILQTYLESNE